MGHDITSYKGETDQGEELAYMRRGAFNPLKATIYQALDSGDCNGGVSGLGMARTFTAEQLRSALSNVPEGGEFDVEREFLKATVNGCGNGPATVFFG